MVGFTKGDRGRYWIGKRPKILLICPNIQVNENPEAFFHSMYARGSHLQKSAVLCILFYGAVLHDNQYSKDTIFSTIAANTSMYFYDPQYTVESEDPRVYRPRLLCYVMV